MPKPSEKYDLVFIFGPDTEVSFLAIQEEINKAKAAGLRCKVIGNGHDSVTDEMLEELEGKIDSSTSININMHGTASRGVHIMKISNITPQIYKNRRPTFKIK